MTAASPSSMALLDDSHEVTPDQIVEENAALSCRVLDVRSVERLALRARRSAMPRPRRSLASAAWQRLRSLEVRVELRLEVGSAA